jgi:alpha-1,3-rhamnosyl/mannosyltransferase
MHIGLEATTLRAPQLGGVWRYTDSLIRALGRRDDTHRYSLLFINALKPWAREPAPRISSAAMRLIEVTSTSNFLFTFVAPFLPPTVSSLAVESFIGRVDLFHSINAVLLAQREGRRVVTVQDLTCPRFPRFHPWSRRVLFGLTVRRAARRADAIIVPSATTERDLAERFPLAAGKTHVVPLAPSERFVLPPERSLPVVRRFGLAPGGYLLFVGNVEPRKNLEALVDDYGRMRAASRLAPILAIAGGRGWKNDPIHRMAADSPFAADIRFLGHVPEPDLPALVNGALAFVYPSLYEGFGLPPLEAKACRTPVLTSDRSSLPEVVGDGALLVDPDDRDQLADALARIAGDAARREGLRERGKQQARHYSWNETARLTVKAYERLAPARERGAGAPSAPTPHSREKS